MVLQQVLSEDVFDDLRARLRVSNATVCVVGLGYVGFPLAEAFSKSLRVIGFDVSERRIATLMEGGIGDDLVLSTRPEMIREADFNIICVPTPVTDSKEPDLRYINSAAEVVGRNMKYGSVVVLESTVYPGLTEEVVVPILEKESGLVCGRDFKVGYSPERINPGDREHEVGKIIKIVSGMDEGTADLLEDLYGRITTPYRARNIRTAEAAKVIENVQRDLNIALMNELSIIFQRMGLSTKDVLDAASTKWNFIRFEPGMVGGHCIPVDPYYLTWKARELGYHSQVILAGRAINDHMPRQVAEMTIKALNRARKVISESKVLVMGLTYKANVPDVRESPAHDLVKELLEYGISVYGYDPLLTEEEHRRFSVTPFDGSAPRMDCLIVTVPHDQFHLTFDELDRMVGTRPVLIDVKGLFDGGEAARRGYLYQRL